MLTCLCNGQAKTLKGEWVMALDVESMMRGKNISNQLALMVMSEGECRMTNA